MSRDGVWGQPGRLNSLRTICWEWAHTAPGNKITETQGRRSS